MSNQMNNTKNVVKITKPIENGGIIQFNSFNGTLNIPTVVKDGNKKNVSAFIQLTGANLIATLTSMYNMAKKGIENGKEVRIPYNIVSKLHYIGNNTKDVYKRPVFFPEGNVFFPNLKTNPNPTNAHTIRIPKNNKLTLSLQIDKLVLNLPLKFEETIDGKGHKFTSETLNMLENIIPSLQGEKIIKFNEVTTYLNKLPNGAIIVSDAFINPTEIIFKDLKDEAIEHETNTRKKVKEFLASAREYEEKENTYKQQQPTQQAPQQAQTQPETPTPEVPEAPEVDEMEIPF